MNPTGVVVLGATGSIGRSTLAVIRRHPGRFRVVGLTAGCRALELERLAREFDPEFVVLAGEGPGPKEWAGAWQTGEEALVAAAASDGADVVVNGLVGFAGLRSTIATLEAGKRLALANKESLVVGGELVLAALRTGGGELIPVDSEHSAIFQCLQDRPREEVARILITASGGPFRALPEARFHEIRPQDALAHPTWTMGDKITVDSATLANKALEVMEAHLLFGVPYESMDVVVHPESIIHSMVEFRDGSTIAQLGYPTMEVPILYALSHPERLESQFKSLDLVATGSLTFERLRVEAFPLFTLGVEAGKEGGTMPAVYSAANEVAVQAFLDGEIGFTDMAGVVEAAMVRTTTGDLSTLEDVVTADASAREAARMRVDG